MSTGADCDFDFKKGYGYSYRIQRWPYGEWPEYDTHGPFKTYRAAREHLDRHYANPGGWSGPPANPDCAHRWEPDLWQIDGKKYERCDDCGASREATTKAASG
jgi:hypothetical protein